MIQIHAFKKKEKEDPNLVALGRFQILWPFEKYFAWWPMEGSNAW
jgi:hypothetical protein